MLRVSFNRKRVKLKQLLGIRARLALLALILVAPLMLERARSLEDARTREIAAASAESSALAEHSADAQREIISSVETILKSAAYIRASAGGVSRSCDMLRASLPANLPWIRTLLIVGKDGRVQCSTSNQYVGLDLSDRDYLRKARDTGGPRITHQLLIYPNTGTDMESDSVRAYGEGYFLTADRMRFYSACLTPVPADITCTSPASVRP